MNVVQLITAGIPQPPFLSNSEAEAEAHYCQLAKECGVEHDFDDVDSSDNSLAELMEEVNSQLEHTEHQLMWWEIEPVVSEQDKQQQREEKAAAFLVDGDFSVKEQIELIGQAQSEHPHDRIYLSTIEGVNEWEVTQGRLTAAEFLAIINS